MFNDINVISYVVVAIVSFLMGAMSKIGYYRIMGKKVVLPFVSETGRNITALGLIVGLASVFTVFTVSSSASETARCNQQYQEALSYNVDVGKEERALNARRDELDSEYQRTLTTAVKDLVTLPPGNGVKTLTVLLETTNRIILDKIGINEELRAKDSIRKPYPEPTCGDD